MDRKIFLQIKCPTNTRSQNLHLTDHQRGPLSVSLNRVSHMNRCTYTNEE